MTTITPTDQKASRSWVLLLQQTVNDWLADKAPRLGAALAYYTIFSLPPLMVLSVALAGLFFRKDVAQGELLRQLRDLLGKEGAEAIQQMIASAQQPEKGILATLLGIVVLLFGASGVFGELQDALNTIWGVEPKTGRGLWGIVKARFLSFAMILGTGFLLLVSLVLSTMLAAAGKWAGNYLPVPEPILQILNFLISVLVITVLFAMIFKILPDARIAWHDVWIGALATALLFSAGKFLLGIYLGRASIGSAYGAAASLIVLLVWVYYSAQILYLGAEFTQAYAHMYGTRILPVGEKGKGR
ncbi:MAG: YihY/virulence factor BrkB family protein [Planctomycetes bacterium]|nr:YihY/virulence factor BrkB family protein [Planctomycetota bacterium]